MFTDDALGLEIPPFFPPTAGATIETAVTTELSDEFGAYPPPLALTRIIELLLIELVRELKDN